MLLNAEIILDNLPVAFGAKASGPGKSALALGRPEFYEGGERPLEEGHLYLTWPERLPRYAHAEQGAVLVCFGESDRLERYRKRCKVITLPHEVDFYQAFNAIQGIFDRYDAWERSLAQVIDEDANVSRMLNLSERIFGNALSAFDADFRVLGASNLSHSLPSQDSFESADGTNLRLAAFDEFLSLHDLSMDERDPILLELRDQVTLSYNLYEEDQFRGCLTVHYRERPFRESDRLALVFLGQMVLRAIRRLSHEAPVGHGSLRQAVQDLVEGIPLDSMGRAAFERAAHRRRFVCLRLKAGNRLANLPIGYIRNMVESTFPKSIAFEHHGNSIVAFVDLDELDPSLSYQEAISQGIDPFVGTMEMQAGLSDPVDDILQARLYYLEANIALENGELFGSGSGLSEFQDHVLEDMVINSLGELPLEMLCPKGMRSLIEHDADSPTSYVETLRTYLEHNLSVTRTATALYVHRSTLLERLGRIRRMLGLDLEDPNTQLRLRLLLKALEVRDTLRQ